MVLVKLQVLLKLQPTGAEWIRKKVKCVGTLSRKCLTYFDLLQDVRDREIKINHYPF